MTVEVATTVAQHSLWAFFSQADPVVKGVMILLVGASVMCWAIILEKAVRLMRVRGAVHDFAAAVNDDRSVAERARIYQFIHDIESSGARAARDEDGEESRADRRHRIERAMRAAMTRALKRLESGLSYLATVGSTAPFVGLFGTVWGIMNSFTAIAASKDTSLAVVAPGIAEALFATALGLVAAIPAVVAYNKFSSGISGIAHELNLAIGEVGEKLSRRQGPESGVAIAGTPALRSGAL